MSEHKFRYLLPPGSDFQFVAKFRTWFTISVILLAVSIGSLFVNKAVRGQYMNWNTDFKGGTEITFSFKDKAGAFTTVQPQDVRKALRDGGEDGFDVSEMSFTADADTGTTAQGSIVRTPRFAAAEPAQQQKAQTAFEESFKDRELLKLNWSGDVLYVRSKKLIANEEAAPAFVTAGLELKPWAEKDTRQFAHADEGTKEYNAAFTVWGIDRQLERVLEKGLPNIDVTPMQSYGVGAKAGDKLRDDAAKSIIFAIFLIMLYLAFRFDIRFAPAAAFATIHDAVMVVGVFSITWQEVSLTTVAAVLTVVGYSVNDTVVIFDRIRENQIKLKDKKLERIVDISLNETLVRSILTSLTVFATTLIMNIFADGAVSNFALAMNVGVIVGSYSSLFLAPPVFLWVARTWYSGPPRTRRVVSAMAPAAAATDAE